MYLLGVGDVLLDPIHQMARIRIKPLKLENSAINPDTISTIDIDNFMIARWNHLTITVEGRSVDVYLNGVLANSLLLPNLPVLNPVGVLIETSPDFSGKAGIIQAWPYRLTDKQVAENYKRNTDTRGKPHLPDMPFQTFINVIRSMGVELCKVGFCGFRIEQNPLTYVDYEFA